MYSQSDTETQAGNKSLKVAYMYVLQQSIWMVILSLHVLIISNHNTAYKTIPIPIHSHAETP